MQPAPEVTTMGRCPGCRRKIGAPKPWCAACETRMPERQRRQLDDARGVLASSVSAGVAWLARHPSASDKDLDILTHAAQGLSNAHIAEATGLSEHAVDDHLKGMSARWQCRGRTALVAKAFHLGYLKIRRSDGVD